jgi:hypothetical protein
LFFSKDIVDFNSCKSRRSFSPRFSGILYWFVFCIIRKKRIIMEDNKNRTGQEQTEQRSNTVKNPDEWTTGSEPMTGAQQSYLKTLSDEAGEDVDANLTKAEASKKIDELQHKTGRGLNDGQ